MYAQRKIRSVRSYRDADHIKVYAISYSGASVNVDKYRVRFEEIKKAQGFDWTKVSAFVIFHDGAEREYLILCWWANGNELFHSVSVRESSGWVEDASRYSFCVYDLEVIWAERNFYVETMDCPQPSIEKYRSMVYSNN